METKEAKWQKYGDAPLPAEGSVLLVFTDQGKYEYCQPYVLCRIIDGKIQMPDSYDYLKNETLYEPLEEFEIVAFLTVVDSAKLLGCEFSIYPEFDEVIENFAKSSGLDFKKAEHGPNGNVNVIPNRLMLFCLDDGVSYPLAFGQFFSVNKSGNTEGGVPTLCFGHQSYRDITGVFAVGIFERVAAYAYISPYEGECGYVAECREEEMERYESDWRKENEV